MTRSRLLTALAISAAAGIAAAILQFVGVAG